MSSSLAARMIKYLDSRPVPIGGITSLELLEAIRCARRPRVRLEMNCWNHGEPHLHPRVRHYRIDPRCACDSNAASVIQHGTPSCSRGTSSPSFSGIGHPPDDRGCREDRELASPMARLQQKTQAAGTTGSAWLSRPSLRDGVTTYTRSSRGPAVLPPSPAMMRWHHRRLGISSGMPEPRDFTVAPDRSSARDTRAATRHAHRIPHPPSVTPAKRPLVGPGC